MLFWLLNFIVEEKISKPRKIKEQFKKMPEHLRKAVEQKNGKEKGEN